MAKWQPQNHTKTTQHQVPTQPTQEIFNTHTVAKFEIKSFKEANFCKILFVNHLLKNVQSLFQIQLEVFYLISNINFGILPVTVFQLEVY